MPILLILLLLLGVVKFPHLFGMGDDADETCSVVTDDTEATNKIDGIWDDETDETAVAAGAVVPAANSRPPALTINTGSSSSSGSGDLRSGGGGGGGSSWRGDTDVGDSLDEDDDEHGFESAVLLGANRLVGHNSGEFFFLCFVRWLVWKNDNASADALLRHTCLC